MITETDDLTANGDLKVLDGLIRTLAGSDLATKLQLVRDNIKERVNTHSAWHRRIEQVVGDWERVANLLGVDSRDRSLVFETLENINALRTAFRALIKEQ